MKIRGTSWSTGWRPRTTRSSPGPSANRLWAHFMGRGLVEPVDDMRVTNPPSNPELLDALAQDFIEHKFDLKHLIRTIMTSTAYQLSSRAARRATSTIKQNYARAYPRRLLAEVMLDAISQVTGVQENFDGLPKGTRAIQLPDESVGSYFLDVFGRPTRETPCECERPREANLAQALHLLNSSDLQNKIASGNGRLAALLKAKKNGCGDHRRTVSGGLRPLAARGGTAERAGRTWRPSSRSQGGVRGCALGDAEYEGISVQSLMSSPHHRARLLGVCVDPQSER